MSKFYISYSQKDGEFASALARALVARGHDVTIDTGLLTPGSEWRESLASALRETEVFLALLTENSLQSPFVLTELGAARAYAQSSDDMLVIPVVADSLPIPNVIADIQAITAPERDIDQIVQDLDRALAALAARRAAKKQQQESKSRVLEAQSAEFIDEALTSLRQNSVRDRRLATVWYVAGFVGVLSGAAFGLIALTQLTIGEAEYVKFGVATLKTIVVIGLLLAAAKYAFVLGRSYMSESLKAADRIHAISFGKFYLRAYGDQADWAQLKEVFQHWNISSPSAFGSTGVDQFDPRYVESLTDLVKAIASKSSEK